MVKNHNPIPAADLDSAAGRQQRDDHLVHLEMTPTHRGLGALLQWRRGADSKEVV